MRVSHTCNSCNFFFKSTVGASASCCRRFELHAGDAVGWLNASKETFDVVIFDLPDFVKGTEFLYQMPVFQVAKEHLTDAHGVVATHSGGNVCTNRDNIDCRYIPILLNSYRKVFGGASLLMAPMPMWEILHGFIVGTASQQTHTFSMADMNARIASRRLATPLRFYNGTTNDILTIVPKQYEEWMTHEKEVMDEAIGKKSACKQAKRLEDMLMR